METAAGQRQSTQAGPKGRRWRGRIVAAALVLGLVGSIAYLVAASNVYYQVDACRMHNMQRVLNAVQSYADLMDCWPDSAEPLTKIVVCQDPLLEPRNLICPAAQQHKLPQPHYLIAPGLFKQMPDTYIVVYEHYCLHDGKRLVLFRNSKTELWGKERDAELEQRLLQQREAAEALKKIHDAEAEEARAVPISIQQSTAKALQEYLSLEGYWSGSSVYPTDVSLPARVIRLKEKDSYLVLIDQYLQSETGESLVDIYGQAVKRVFSLQPRESGFVVVEKGFMSHLSSDVQQALTTGRLLSIVLPSKFRPTFAPSGPRKEAVLAKVRSTVAKFVKDEMANRRQTATALDVSVADFDVGYECTYVVINANDKTWAVLRVYFPKQNLDTSTYSYKALLPVRNVRQELLDHVSLA